MPISHFDVGELSSITTSSTVFAVESTSISVQTDISFCVDGQTQTENVTRADGQTQTDKRWNNAGSKNIKRFSDCTQSAQSKKMQRIKQALIDEKMDEEFEIVPKKKKTEADKEFDSLFIRNSLRQTEEQYAGIARQAPESFVPLTKLKMVEKNILMRCPVLKTKTMENHSSNPAVDLTLYYYDLREVLEHMVLPGVCPS